MLRISIVETRGDSSIKARICPLWAILSGRIGLSPALTATPNLVTSNAKLSMSESRIVINCDHDVMPEKERASEIAWCSLYRGLKASRDIPSNRLRAHSNC